MRGVFQIFCMWMVAESVDAALCFSDLKIMTGIYVTIDLNYFDYFLL